MTTQEFLDRGFRPDKDDNENDSAVLIREVLAKYGHMVIHAVPLDQLVGPLKTWDVIVTIGVEPSAFGGRRSIDSVEQYNTFLRLAERAKDQDEFNLLNELSDDQ